MVCDDPSRRTVPSAMACYRSCRKRLPTAYREVITSAWRRIVNWPEGSDSKMEALDTQRGDRDAASWLRERTWWAGCATRWAAASPVAPARWEGRSRSTSCNGG
ncbi:MAG: hypothetical protein ACREOA_04655 [Candidatus Dormibacteria bacterium]